MGVGKNIKLLSWLGFWCDFRLYDPVAILYFAKVTGSYALGMSVFAIIMLSQSVFEVPTGIFSDLIGRRKTVILGGLASVLAVVCYAIGASYLFLIIGAVFEGISRSFYSGNNDAMLMDTLKEEGREEQFHSYAGKIGAYDQAALAISALLGGVLAMISFKLALWISVLPQILCVVVGILLVEPKIFTRGESNVYDHLWQSIKLFWKNPKLRLLSLVSSLGYAAGESGYQFRSAFIALFWPVWAIGFVTMLANAGASLSFYFSGKAIKRFKELPIIIFCNIYNRIVTLMGLIFASVISPILMSSSSLLFGVEMTAEKSLLQKEFTDKERATMGSINSLLGSFLFAVISVSLGFVADGIGPIKALLILQIPLVIVLFLTWRLYFVNRSRELL